MTAGSILRRDYIAELLFDTGLQPIFIEKERRANIVLKLNTETAFDNDETYRLVVGGNADKNKIVVTA